jgi:hypothetical protein
MGRSNWSPYLVQGQELRYDQGVVARDGGGGVAGEVRDEPITDGVVVPDQDLEQEEIVLDDADDVVVVGVGRAQLPDDHTFQIWGQFGQG